VEVNDLLVGVDFSAYTFQVNLVALDELVSLCLCDLAF